MCPGIFKKPKAPKVESEAEARARRDGEVAALQQKDAIRNKSATGYYTSGIGSTLTLGDDFSKAKF